MRGVRDRETGLPAAMQYTHDTLAVNNGSTEEIVTVTDLSSLISGWLIG